MDITQQKLHLAHKVTYLKTRFPDEPITSAINRLIGMPAIQQNMAYWEAQKLGLLGEPNPKDGTFELLKTPETWEFSDSIKEIEAMVTECFGILAKTERDLDEETLTYWLVGYLASDVLVALHHLLETKVLGKYELTDPKDLKSTYTFYSLHENSEQMWGRKFFKEQPTGEEVPEGEE